MELLIVNNYPVSYRSTILDFILLIINIYMQQMFFKGFTLGYTAYIIYAPLAAALFSRLYSVFVFPYLDYCDVVWTPSSVQHLRHSERLHSKFP